MKFVLPATIAVVLFVGAPNGVQAQDDTNTLDDTPHITIVGSASIETAPDLATITLGVTKRATAAKDAAAAVAAGAQAIVDAAKEEGVKDADIKTQSVSLVQTFDELHDPQGRFTGRRPSGFEASNVLAVRVRDLAKAGALAQALIDKGANTFDGVAFSIEHPQPILDRLAADAVANARRQAEMVAHAAGVKLGRVLLIERPSASPSGPVFAATSRLATAPKAMPIEAGTQSLATEMEVTWAIE